MGGNYTLPALPMGAQFVVDKVTGNDNTGSRYGKPYLTIAAALAAATAGSDDTILVLAGAYTDSGMTLKNKVHFYFMPGAKITTSGATNPLIFTDAGAAVTCVIDGAGEFFLAGSATDYDINWRAILTTNNAATNIVFRGKTLSAQEDDTHSACLAIQNASRVVIDVQEIVAGVASNCMMWGGGDFYCRAKIIRASAGSISYTVWAVEPAGAAVLNGYVEADLIDNPGYAAISQTGLTANWKLWVNAKEIRGTLGGASQAVIESLGNGKIYVKAEKINCKNAPLLKQTGGEVWIQSQKVSSDISVGDPNLVNNVGRFVWITGGTLYMNVDHFECVTAGLARAFWNNGGTVHLRGMQCLIDNGSGFTHDAGTSHISDLRIDTSGTNSATNRPVILGGAGCTLKNCTLVNPALCLESVYAAAAQTLKSKGTCVKVAKHANVTVQIEALLVDANVS